MNNKTIHLDLYAFVSGVIILGLLFSGTAFAASTDGIVAEYHFDGDAKDTSGNGNNGIIYGATFVEGIKGKALSFDGVYAYVDVGDPASGVLDFGTADSFTVILFANFDEFASTKWLINKGGPNLRHPGYQIVRDSSNLELSISDGSASSTIDYPVSNLLNGEWYHIALIRDVANDKIHAYINGVEVVAPVTDTTTGTLATNDSLFIGSRSDGYRFDGTLDEIRIYKRALSADEIRTDYDTAKNATTSKYNTIVPASQSSKKDVTEDWSFWIIAAITTIVVFQIIAFIIFKRDKSIRENHGMMIKQKIDPEAEKYLDYGNEAIPSLNHEIETLEKSAAATIQEFLKTEELLKKLELRLKNNEVSSQIFEEIKARYIKKTVALKNKTEQSAKDIERLRKIKQFIQDM